METAFSNQWIHRCGVVLVAFIAAVVLAFSMRPASAAEGLLKCTMHLGDDLIEAESEVTLDGTVDPGPYEPGETMRIHDFTYTQQESGGGAQAVKITFFGQVTELGDLPGAPDTDSATFGPADIEFNVPELPGIYDVEPTSLTLNALLFPMDCEFVGAFSLGTIEVLAPEEPPEPTVPDDSTTTTVADGAGNGAGEGQGGGSTPPSGGAKPIAGSPSYTGSPLAVNRFCRPAHRRCHGGRTTALGARARSITPCRPTAPA